MVPNKTIYVSDDDMPLYKKAQDLAGGNLSAAISAALRRYVQTHEDRAEGYGEIVVRVGPGKGRKQRFTGVLLGEWGRSTAHRVEMFRVYGTRSGKFVVHTERSQGWTAGGPDAEKWNSGWRAWVGNWSANQSWGVIPADSRLRVANSLDELRDLLPPELYEIVVDIVDQPPIEDLDL
jgi:EXLDI family protein